LLIEIILHDLRVGYSPAVSRSSLGYVIADTLERKDHQFSFSKNFSSIVDPKGKELCKACILVCSGWPPILLSRCHFLCLQSAIQEASRTVNLRYKLINRKLAT
jgi:hypothetical protein